jgi:hypothetical protein
MRTKTLLYLFILATLGCGKQEEAPPQWISLFNGKDLDGWTVKLSGYEVNDNYKNTFRVEDGVLKVSYDDYEQFDGEFGHLFYKEPFSHYLLRVEYRFVGEQVSGGADWAFKNSGAMLHAQSPESMGLDQDFPVSIEAQFLGGGPEGERPTGNLCTPGTHVRINGEPVTDHCINSTSKTYRGDEWVTIEMIVRGDSIIHHVVEGDTVMTYSHTIIGGDHKPEGYPVPDGTPLKNGYIALQAESHPIEFRKVELMVLTGD